MEPSAARVHSQNALAVYAESLVAGRRVAVFGDASLGLGAQLVDLGARAVSVWDPDAGRASREGQCSSQGVAVYDYPGSDREARSGGFDLAIVADLGLFDSPEALLARVRDLVGERGAALVVGANRGGVRREGSRAFDYYELFDLVAREFDDVRMIAQLRFEGVAFAELGERDDPPAVSVDTQLADSERAPAAFIALGSQRDIRLEPYAIVELLPPPSVESSAEGDATRAELAEARVRLELLQEQVDEVRERESRVAELEGALSAQAQRMAQMSNELEAMRVAGEGARITAAEVEELSRRASRAESAAARMEPELARIQDGQVAELARFEEALRDRARTVRQLEVEIVRRDGMVRELVDSLGEGTVTAPERAPQDDGLVEENALLRHKLDGLALDLARREADAQSSAWTLAELQRAGARAEEPASGRPPAAVVDDLAIARAEIQRQAVLLEQLGRELEGPRKSASERQKRS